MLKFFRLCCPKKTAKNDKRSLQADLNDLRHELHERDASMLELKTELAALKDQMQKDQRALYIEVNQSFTSLKNKHDLELQRKDEEMKRELRKKDALILELRQELAAQKREIYYLKGEEHLLGHPDYQHLASMVKQEETAKEQSGLAQVMGLLQKINNNSEKTLQTVESIMKQRESEMASPHADIKEAKAQVKETSEPKVQIKGLLHVKPINGKSETDTPCVAAQKVKRPKQRASPASSTNKPKSIKGKKTCIKQIGFNPVNGL